MIGRIKETGIYFIGTIGVAVISFVISLLYTHMFATEAYGYYSLLAALYSLLFQLFTGWMTHSILRYFPEEKDKNNAKSFRNTMVFIHLFLCIVFSIIMAFCMIIYKDTSILFQMLLVYIGVFIFEGFLQILNTFLRAEGKSKQYSINTVVNSLLKSVFVILLYYLFGRKSIVIIVVSLLLAECIQCVFLFFKFNWNKIINFKYFDISLAKKVIAFGYPLIGVSIIFNVLTYSDRYIISFYLTKSDVGLYSYGYNMGYSLFYAMTNAIMLGAYPRITHEWKENGRESTEKLVTKYLNLYFYLMIPATVGVMVIGGKVIQSLCGEAFWASSKVFIITCISYALFGILQYTNKAWELTANTKRILYLNIGSAILNIILNFLLVPVFGYTVAAVTTLISFFVYIIFSIFLSRKIFRFHVDLNTLIKIMISALFMGIITRYIDGCLKTSFVLVLFEILVAMLLYFIALLLMKDKLVMLVIDCLRK